MTNLAKQEINLRIAKLVFPDAEVMRAGNKSFVFIEYNGRLENTVDYCSNWNDLMPLVVEHGISLKRFKKGWDITHKSGFWEFTNKDPQMTLALCLLKVLQEKEKDNG